MSVDSVSVSVGRCDSVRLWASRSEAWACLVIDTDGAYCEVQLDRVHVEALRDQLPEVLAGLDRCAAEDARCARAIDSRQWAADAAARAVDLATTADAAGAHGEAESLRAAAGEATARAEAVDVAVHAFEDAAVEADHAAERLVHLTGETDAVLRRSAVTADR